MTNAASMPRSLGRFQKMRKVALAILMALVFVLLLFVDSNWQGRVHEAIEFTGLALIVIGIVGRMWCTLYIGGRKSAEIVASGPYSISRNPLYVFSSVAAAGVGAQTGSATVAVLFLLGCAAAFYVVILREERFLKRNFGSIYRAYLVQVPRFWPRFSRYIDHAELTVSTKRIYATLADGLVFFAAVPIFEFVEHLQRAGDLPVVLTLY